MKDETKDIILKWYHRSQLDYWDQYINLFIAYNAWYKKVTGKTKDRDAIDALKKRTGIWQQYVEGETMQELSPSLITNERPLINLTRDVNPHWDGVVKDQNDWHSLIEYWYRVRSNLFHGSKSPEDGRESKLVELAYKSLNVFMTEVVKRMESSFSSEDLDRIYDISLMMRPRKSKEGDFERTLYTQRQKGLQEEREKIFDKFRNARNLWEVDL